MQQIALPKNLKRGVDLETRRQGRVKTALALSKRRRQEKIFHARQGFTLKNINGTLQYDFDPKLEGIGGDANIVLIDASMIQTIDLAQVGPLTEPEEPEIIVLMKDGSLWNLQRGQYDRTQQYARASDFYQEQVPFLGRADAFERATFESVSESLQDALSNWLRNPTGVFFMNDIDDSLYKCLMVPVQQVLDIQVRSQNIKVLLTNQSTIVMNASVTSANPNYTISLYAPMSTEPQYTIEITKSEADVFGEWARQVQYTKGYASAF